MKKLIILLMAVSIMLTSCGKSAGLSNSDKKTDNKSLATIKENPEQILNNKSQERNNNNNVKQSRTDFANDHIKAIGFIVLVVVIGSFFVGKWIINRQSEKKELPKEQPEINGQHKPQEPPNNLKPLPKPYRYYLNSFFIRFFSEKLPNEDFVGFNYKELDDHQLVYVYNLDSTLPDWRSLIKIELANRGYNVSTLE